MIYRALLVILLGLGACSPEPTVPTAPSAPTAQGTTPTDDSAALPVTAPMKARDSLLRDLKREGAAADDRANAFDAASGGD